ncbi:MAG: condensation domain-containing protein, partial [Psychrosphaera sp.]|nr:condensation domain-containing protein [Psychrosphaera sp.]
DSFDGDSAQYNMPSAFSIKGSFDEAIAQRVLTALIERHETLRTNIVKTDDDVLVQQINPTFDFKLNCHDLSDIDTQQQTQLVQQLLDADSIKPFDLAEDLMMRALFIRLGQNDAVLMLNTHHIAADGWSMGVLTQEFSQLYSDFSNDRACSLEPLTIGYADYVAWQGKTEGHSMDKQRDYWQQQLADLPVVHNLPLISRRPAVLTLEGANYTSALDANLSAKIRAYTEQNDLTVFMFLQGAFSLLVSKFSNQADVVLGTPVANRRHAQLQNLVGFFIDNQVLRVDCQPDMTLANYYTQVRKVNLDALQHNQVGFNALIDLIKPQRSTNNTPLFQIMFTMDNTASAKPADGQTQSSDFTLGSLSADKVMAKYELQLSASLEADVVEFNFEYNQNLFDADLIARLAKGLNAIIMQVLETPNQAINQLCVIDKAERTELVETLNQTKVSFAEQALMHQKIEAQVAKTPLQTAVVYEQTQLTFSQLNQRANQLARHLQTLGLAPGKVAGLVFDRSIDLA